MTRVAIRLHENVLLEAIQPAIERYVDRVLEHQGSPRRIGAVCACGWQGDPQRTYSPLSPPAMSVNSHRGQKRRVARDELRKEIAEAVLPLALDPNALVDALAELLSREASA